MLDWARSVIYMPSGLSYAKPFRAVDLFLELSELTRRTSVFVHDDAHLRSLSSSGILVDEAFTRVAIDRHWLRKNIWETWKPEQIGFATWESCGWAHFWVALGIQAVQAGLLPSSALFKGREYLQASGSGSTEKSFGNLLPPPVEWSMAVVSSDLLSFHAPRPFLGRPAAAMEPLFCEQAIELGYPTVQIPSSGLPVRGGNAGHDWVVHACLAVKGPDPAFDPAWIRAILNEAQPQAVFYLASLVTLTTSQLLSHAHRVNSPDLLPLFLMAGMTAETPIEVESLHIIMDLPSPVVDVPWLAWAAHGRPSLVQPLFDALPSDRQAHLAQSLTGPLSPWRLLVNAVPELLDHDSWSLFEWLKASDFSMEGVSVTPLILSEFQNFRYRPDPSRSKLLSRLGLFLGEAMKQGATLDAPVIFQALAERVHQPGWLEALFPFLPPFASLSEEQSSDLLYGFSRGVNLCSIEMQAAVEQWEKLGWRWRGVWDPAWPNTNRQFIADRQEWFRLKARSNTLAERLPASLPKPVKPRF